jgi:prevent-host-death family protein
MRVWKLEDAKNRFSELVREAIADGPQRVTRSGKSAVVVMSARDYERLTAPENLVEFLRDSPFGEAIAEGELDLERSGDAGRTLVF